MGLQTNLESYAGIYGSKRTFLRYPADWVIRFHNIWMRKNMPSGSVLDYGCGSGNNMRFFLDQGYQVHGIEIAKEVLPLIQENVGDIANVTIRAPTDVRLPYPDATFDFVLANQVLYYLIDRHRIRALAVEFNRVLKPGGVIFVTMIGLENYFITKGYATTQGESIYELKIGGDHRLNGTHQVFYVIRNETDLTDLFSMFRPLTVGFFDQGMFDMTSNFHWIFAGTK